MDEKARMGLAPLYTFDDIDPDRPFVQFKATGKQKHYLTVPEDLGPVMLAKIHSLEARVMKIREMHDDGDLDGEASDMMMDMLRQMAYLILGNTERKIIDAMTENQLHILIQLFRVAVVGEDPTAIAEESAEPEEPLPPARPARSRKSIGGAKSRRSNASTEEAPANG